MTLSPDADKGQVRQAVIDLIADYEKRMEEAERRIELLSNALKSTLSSRTEPRPTEGRKFPEPVSNHHFDQPDIGYNAQKGMYFHQRADGQTSYYTEDKVPADIRDRLNAGRQPGTPRIEIEGD